MKKIIEVVCKENAKQRYGKVSTIAKIFDMDRTTVCSKLEAMRKAGCYDDAVIEEGPKSRRINIDKFEAFLQSCHKQYLRA